MQALDQIEPVQARFIAAFGYVLGRVANADGTIGTPTLMDVKGRKVPARRLELLSSKRCGDDLLWLLYARKR